MKLTMLEEYREDYNKIKKDHPELIKMLDKVEKKKEEYFLNDDTFHLLDLIDFQNLTIDKIENYYFIPEEEFCGILFFIIELDIYKEFRDL